MDIPTTLEYADGRYMLLPVDKSFPDQELYSELDELGNMLDEIGDDSDYILGQWPHMVRTRPDHDIFNNLAISIARTRCPI
jgi:hypothetical protein